MYKLKDHLMLQLCGASGGLMSLCLSFGELGVTGRGWSTSGGLRVMVPDSERVFSP